MRELFGLIVHTLKTKPALRAVAYGAAVALIVYVSDPYWLTSHDQLYRALWMGVYSAAATVFPRTALWFVGFSAGAVTVLTLVDVPNIRFGSADAVRAFILMIPMVLPALALFITKNTGPKVPTPDA